MTKRIINKVIHHANKIVEDGLKARHERFKAGEEIYNQFHTQIKSKKIEKIISKNEQSLSNNLNNTPHKRQEELYIEALMTENDLTGSMLYDWDKKDGNIQNTGGYKFSCIKDSQIYKDIVSENEMQLFKKHSKQLGELILLAKPERIIDMGGGDGIKTTKILSLIPTAALANINITTKDISPYLMDEYTKNLQNWNINHGNPITVKARYENFLDSHELLSNKDKRLFLFKGGTIGQFDDETIKKILGNIFSESLLGKRYSIITVFIAPDRSTEDYEDEVNKLLAAYGTSDALNPYYDAKTHKLIEDWIMSGIYHWLGDQVKGKLKFQVTYEDNGEKGGRLLLGAKVLEPIEVKIGTTVYKKEPGDMIYAIQSRRFTKQHYTKLANESGHHIDAFDSEKGVGLALMHTSRYNTKNLTPSRIASWKRKGKLFGAGLLLLGGMYLGGKWNELKSERQKEKNLQEILHNKLVNKNKDFISVVESYYSNLFRRYDIRYLSPTKQEYIKELLMQRMLNQDESLLSTYVSGPSAAFGIEDRNDKVSELIALFIEENIYLLTQADISIQPHQSLEKYEDVLKNTLDEKSDTVSVKQFSLDIKNGYGAKLERLGYKRLGVYTTRTGKEFIYGIHNLNDKDYIVAMPAMDGKGTALVSEVDVGKSDMGLPKDNSDYYGQLTIRYGKEIANDYFQKPYVHIVTKKIEKILGEEERDILVRTGEIISRFTYLIKDGYDFGWLAYSKNKKDILAYTHTFNGYLYGNDTTSSAYNKNTQIDNIFNTIDKIYFAGDIRGQLYASERGNLKSKIFHELCKDSSGIDLSIQSNMIYWIEKNNNLFKGYMENTYPLLSAENDIDSDKFSGISPYIKSMPDDILQEPSETVSIYSYIDRNGNQYAIKIFKGNVYARLKNKNASDIIHNMVDKIIQQCVDKNIGPRRKELEEFYDDKGGIPPTLTNSRMMFKMHIQNNLYTYNTEFGNMVLEDFKIKRLHASELERAKLKGWVK